MMSYTVPVRRRRLPIFLTINNTAKILGWDWHTVRHWAYENDLIEEFAGRAVISVRRIKQAFPDTYDELFG